MKVFISYRREDSQSASMLIYRELTRAIGAENVFFDVDNIPFGVNFKTHLHNAVTECGLMLVIIGKTWADARDADGERRLEDPRDFVRIEIESALGQGLTVVPVLVEGAKMPKAILLPETLADFVYLNAAELNTGKDFDSHIQRLIRSIERIRSAQPKAEAAEQTTSLPDLGTHAFGDTYLSTDVESLSEAGIEWDQSGIFEGYRHIPVFVPKMTTRGEHTKTSLHKTNGRIYRGETLVALDLRIMPADEAVNAIVRLEPASVIADDSSLNHPETMDALRSRRDLALVVPKVRDTDVGQWAAALPALSALNLRFNRVTDQGLKHLKALTQLRSLSLPANRGVTDQGLVHLESLTQLRHLNLYNTQVTDQGLVHLESLTQLRHLHLSNTQVTDQGLVHLESLTQLRYLDLCNTGVTDHGLVHLKGLTELRHLDLSNFKVTVEVTDHGLRHLRVLTQLRHLDLSNTKVTGDGLTHLRALTQLRTLNLHFTKVTHYGLVHLKGLTHLRHLNLSNTQVTNYELEHLKGLTELRTLDLSDTDLTDHGLPHLRVLTQLETLDLSENIVTDQGFEDLKVLTQLRHLNLSNTNVTDDGLQHLKALTELRTLELYSTDVTDRGVKHLKALTQLRNLHLGVTGITEAGLAVLWRHLPNCNITHSFE